MVWKSPQCDVIYGIYEHKQECVVLSTTLLIVMVLLTFQNVLRSVLISSKLSYMKGPFSEIFRDIIMAFKHHCIPHTEKMLIKNFLDAQSCVLYQNLKHSLVM